jgi:hypothetical protein
MAAVALSRLTNTRANYRRVFARVCIGGSRPDKPREDRTMTFNLKQYAGEHFIKPDDVRDHPLRRQIAVVREGKFGKLDFF